VIEKQEGMDMQTFNQIAQAQQQGGGDFSEEKMAAFQKVSMKLQQKQQEMQQEMAERLPEEVGISMKKFQEMMMAYRQDPAFQKEVQAKMQN
jgi:DNA-binding transcriptional MerR regulator